MQRVCACTLLFLSLSLLSFGCSNLPAEHTVIKPVQGEVRIPVKDVNDGKVHFYTYKSSGKRINFFVRTDSKGRLSTYFDACYTCYKNKKGYRCEGTDLVCNECNLRFKLAEEKWVHEGCSPISLTNRMEGGNIIIRTDDLEKGGRLF
jgi:uncharacterized membrane protein